MNSQMFVDAIKDVVIESTITSMKMNLENPPGRKPSQNLRELSEWFNSCDNSERNMILNLIKEAVEKSVFGFLCVLDGVRSIKERGENGVLKLTYESTSGIILLNDAAGESLHDLL